MPWTESGNVSLNKMKSHVVSSVHFALRRNALTCRNMEGVRSCLISSVESQTESCSFIMICKIKPGTQLTTLASCRLRLRRSSQSSEAEGSRKRL
jgi:hypothetical protein